MTSRAAGMTSRAAGMTPAPVIRSAPPAQVRGDATAEEIAAIVAALDAAVRVARPSMPPEPSGYARWRRTRLQALRAR